MSAVPVIARQVESAQIGRFLDALPGGSRCLLIEGEVGIGKTTLLSWAKATATDRGYRVLSANPVESEVPWEFTALADLLEAIPRAAVDELPEPQRRAVDVAVFREQLSDIPVDPRTLATAVLGVVRSLAAEAPVLLAVDDLPLLDRPSARVLSYVLRRAGEAAVGLLGVVRTELSTEPASLAIDSVESHRMERIDVRALTLEATRELIRSRTGVTPGRSGLARLHELSRGNPLFALELVAENAIDVATGPAGSMSVPESLRRLVRHRMSPITAGGSDVLLVAALTGEPLYPVVLAAAADPQNANRDLERAVDAGIVQRTGDGLVFAHPLIRSVVSDDATAEQRRAVHRRLASAVRHPEVRARHLALAADGPDERVARAVEDASLSAMARGACETAAVLAELAVRLTPSRRLGDEHRRKILEAENRFEASEPARACALLETVVGTMPSGPSRAELLRRLARYSAFRGGPTRWIATLTKASEESGEDPMLRAVIAMDLAVAANNLSDEATARDYTERAAELVEQSGDAALEARLYAGMAFVRFSRGEGVHRDLIDRGLIGSDQPLRLSMELRPRVVVGHVLHLSDDLDGARALYETEHVRALAEGVETGLPLLLWGMIETEAWAGNWDRAEELVAEGSEVAEEIGGPMKAMMMATSGIMHVYRGRLEEGWREGEFAVTAAAEFGWPLAALVAGQALGLSALSVGDAAGAHHRLAPAMSFVRSARVTEPGLLHFVPDEIEALIRLGDLDSSDEMLSSFEERSAALGRVSGMATAGRCRALLLAARGDLDAADAAVDGALERHRTLPMPFEHGRTLLVAGEIARRARRKRRAQEVIEAAIAIFGKLGAPVWEERAREELGRLGLRTTRTTRGGTELTEAEHRVAELVAAGLSNAEVAARLFMAQRTVEAHLSKIYRKLGVRSRTQLLGVYQPSPS